MTQLSTTTPASSCEMATASANFPVLESAHTCRTGRPPLSFLHSAWKKKKNGSRSRALCSTSAGVLYTGCFSHASEACWVIMPSAQCLHYSPSYFTRALLLPLCHERCICACSRAYVPLQLLAINRRAVQCALGRRASDRRVQALFDERTKTHWLKWTIETRKKNPPLITRKTKTGGANLLFSLFSAEPFQACVLHCGQLADVAGENRRMSAAPTDDVFRNARLAQISRAALYRWRVLFQRGFPVGVCLQCSGIRF